MYTSPNAVDEIYVGFILIESKSLHFYGKVLWFRRNNARRCTKFLINFEIFNGWDKRGSQSLMPASPIK